MQTPTRARHAVRARPPLGTCILVILWAAFAVPLFAYGLRMILGAEQRRTTWTSCLCALLVSQAIMLPVAAARTANDATSLHNVRGAPVLRARRFRDTAATSVRIGSARHQQNLLWATLCSMSWTSSTAGPRRPPNALVIPAEPRRPSLNQGLSRSGACLQGRAEDIPLKLEGPGRRLQAKGADAVAMLSQQCASETAGPGGPSTCVV